MIFIMQKKSTQKRKKWGIVQYNEVIIKNLLWKENIIMKRAEDGPLTSCENALNFLFFYANDDDNYV